MILTQVIALQLLEIRREASQIAIFSIVPIIAEDWVTFQDINFVITVIWNVILIGRCIIINTIICFPTTFKNTVIWSNEVVFCFLPHHLVATFIYNFRLQRETYSRVVKAKSTVTRNHLRARIELTMGYFSPVHAWLIGMISISNEVLILNHYLTYRWCYNILLN